MEEENNSFPELKTEEGIFKEEISSQIIPDLTKQEADEIRENEEVEVIKKGGL
jgi:hypothetical protein